MTKKNLSKTKSHLNVISKAYDKTVHDHSKGIENENLLPDEFQNSERYKKLQQSLKTDSFSSDNPTVFEYLNPKKNMKFLDVGSCANLICKKLHEWPSMYYGVDISSELIRVSQNFVKRNEIKIGGLYVSEVAEMKFEDNFFDICAVIGVLEYFDVNYIKKALKELHRVLKPQGKIVLDIPNLNHPDCETMIEQERYLGRTSKNVPTNEEFEIELKKLFSIDKIDSSKIMTGYFAQASK